MRDEPASYSNGTEDAGLSLYSDSDWRADYSDCAAFAISTVKLAQSGGTRGSFPVVKRRHRVISRRIHENRKWQGRAGECLRPHIASRCQLAFVRVMHFLTQPTWLVPIAVRRASIAWRPIEKETASTLPVVTNIRDVRTVPNVAILRSQVAWRIRFACEIDARRSATCGNYLQFLGMENPAVAHRSIRLQIQRGLALLAVFALCLPTVVRAGLPAIDAYNIGRYHYSTAAYEKAVEAFSEAITMNPRYAAAYIARAKSCCKLGRHSLAIADITVALQFFPRNADALAVRGEAHLGLGNTDEAIVDLNQSLELDPRNTNALVERGIAYELKGQSRLAEEDLRAAELASPGIAQRIHERIVSLRGSAAVSPANAASGEVEPLPIPADAIVREQVPAVRPITPMVRPQEPIDPGTPEVLPQAEAKPVSAPPKVKPMTSESTSTPASRMDEVPPEARPETVVMPEAPKAPEPVTRSVSTSVKPQLEEPSSARLVEPRQQPEPAPLEQEPTRVAMPTVTDEPPASMQREAEAPARQVMEADRPRPSLEYGRDRFEARDFVAALAEFDALVAAAPGESAAYCERGKTNAAMGRLHEAELDLEVAVRLAPGNAEYYHERAAILVQLGRVDDAQADRAIAFRLQRGLEVVEPLNSTAGAAMRPLAPHESPSASAPSHGFDSSRPAPSSRREPDAAPVVIASDHDDQPSREPSPIGSGGFATVGDEPNADPTAAPKPMGRDALVPQIPHEPSAQVPVPGAMPVDPTSPPEAIIVTEEPLRRLPPLNAVTMATPAPKAEPSAAPVGVSDQPNDTNSSPAASRAPVFVSDEQSPRIVLQVEPNGVPHNPQLSLMVGPSNQPAPSQPIPSASSGAEPPQSTLRISAAPDHSAEPSAVVTFQRELTAEGAMSNQPVSVTLPESRPSEATPLAADAEAAALEVTEETITSLNEAIKQRPGYAELYLARGKLYARHGEFRYALSDFNAAARLDPQSAVVLAERGRLRMALREFEKAAEDFTAALQVSPGEAAITIDLGKVCNRLGKFPEAIAALSAALESDPDHALAYFERSRAQKSLGHAAEAAADMREARRLDPSLTP